MLVRLGLDRLVLLRGVLVDLQGLDMLFAELIKGGKKVRRLRHLMYIFLSGQACYRTRRLSIADAFIFDDGMGLIKTCYP